MASFNPLAVAALGLLAERPMHPYEMYQLLIEREEDRLLKVRPGTLYHAVARLAAAGLVEPVGTERAGNRPERTRYRITDQGRERLAAQLVEMLAHPADEFPQFPLAIGEAHNLPLDEVVACLRTRIERLTADHDSRRSRVTGRHAPAVPRRYWIDVDYSLAMQRAEIQWLEHFLREVLSGALPWDGEHEAAGCAPDAESPASDDHSTATSLTVGAKGHDHPVTPARLERPIEAVS